jgi:hypothetical protein
MRPGSRYARPDKAPGFRRGLPRAHNGVVLLKAQFLEAWVRNGGSALGLPDRATECLLNSGGPVHGYNQCPDMPAPASGLLQKEPRTAIVPCAMQNHCAESIKPTRQSSGSGPEEKTYLRVAELAVRACTTADRRMNGCRYSRRAPAALPWLRQLVARARQEGVLRHYWNDHRFDMRLPITDGGRHGAGVAIQFTATGEHCSPASVRRCLRFCTTSTALTRGARIESSAGLLRKLTQHCGERPSGAGRHIWRATYPRTDARHALSPAAPRATLNVGADFGCNDGLRESSRCASALNRGG